MPRTNDASANYIHSLISPLQKRSGRFQWTPCSDTRGENCPIVPTSFTSITKNLATRHMLRIFQQHTKQNLCLIFNGDIACLMNIVCSAVAFPATNETPEIRGQISFSSSYKYGPE